MRGKGAENEKGEKELGITPAHAGKSLAESSLVIPIQDHPRACGEKHPQSERRADWPGITPAHAGKS